MAGGLLAQIQSGTSLRKVEEEKEKEKGRTDPMGFNIAMILARREAIEDSDSESEDDWED